jgi:hypothetical protein
MSFDWKAAVPWIFLPFVGSIPGNLMANPKNKTWYKVR